MIDTINIANRYTSRKLSISEEIVKEVNRYFWKEGVKGTMKTGKYTAFRIPKLGTFVVSRLKLRKRISKYIAYIRFLKQEDQLKFKKISKEDRINQYQEELKLLLDRRNDLAKLYIKKI